VRVCDYCGDAITVGEVTVVANMPLMDPQAPDSYVQGLDLHLECGAPFAREVQKIKGKRPTKPPN
jgi:hypothetical protein